MKMQKSQGFMSQKAMETHAGAIFFWYTCTWELAEVPWGLGKPSHQNWIKYQTKETHKYREAGSSHAAASRAAAGIPESPEKAGKSKTYTVPCARRRCTCQSRRTSIPSSRKCFNSRPRCWQTCIPAYICSCIGKNMWKLHFELDWNTDGFFGVLWLA